MNDIMPITRNVAVNYNFFCSTLGTRTIHIFKSQSICFCIAFASLVFTTELLFIASFLIALCNIHHLPQNVIFIIVESEC